MLLDGGTQAALQALIQGQITGLIEVLSDVYQWIRLIAVHNDETSSPCLFDDNTKKRPAQIRTSPPHFKYFHPNRIQPLGKGFIRVASTHTSFPYHHLSGITKLLKRYFVCCIQHNKKEF
jgi:hypothetical protein